MKIRHGSGRFRSPRGSVRRSLIVAGSLVIGAASVQAQGKTAGVADAQIEADVLQALAGNPKLAEQQVSTTTVFGVVTLSGRVKNEEARVLAEDVVARTVGVKKVVDELVVGELTQEQKSEQGRGSTPPLQSDGTDASAQEQVEGRADEPAAGGSGIGSRSEPAIPVQRSSSAKASPSTQQQADDVASGRTPHAPPGQGAPASGSASDTPSQPPFPPPTQPTYDQQGEPPYRSSGQPSRPQTPYDASQPPSRQGGPPPYPAPASRPEDAERYDRGRYGVRADSNRGQIAGVAVHVPAGATLEVWLSQGLNSKYSQTGDVFTGVVAADIVAGGFVAIPRGASVLGTVVDASRSGVLKGRGSLSLQLTQITLGGRVYPLRTAFWSQAGRDKTVRTVDSALGLGAVGAILGGVAGGGVGAAIGAGAGGAAGVGASAASEGGQVTVPPEALLPFQLAQTADLTTVSQAEMERLAYGVPNGAIARRRVGPPPYPYGPGYPYPRYYYRQYYRPYYHPYGY